MGMSEIYFQGEGRARVYSLGWWGDMKLFYSIISFMEEQTKVTISERQQGKWRVKSGRQ